MAVASEHKARVAWLTSGPVVQTLQGTRKRIELLSDEDTKLLMKHYGCGIEDLQYQMWKSKHNRRRLPARTNLVPAYGLFRSHR